MTKKENPSYYAIIPAEVRYNENLKPNEKLLYGEIMALTNKTGICYASNDYFANLYGVSKISVSKWISNLQKEGFIERGIMYKNGTKQIEDRYLRKVNDPIKEKVNTPIKEKFKENNTSKNNTSNNNSFVGQSTNSVPYKEVIEYLNEKTGKNFKHTSDANRRVIRARFNEGNTLEDFKRVIDNKAVDWLNDYKMKKYLRPVTLFNASKFEGYLNENKSSKDKPKNEEIERKWTSVD